jgi:predicted PurR-regulated permease PerM
MIERNAERLFFLALVCAITIAFFWLIHDLLQPIFWAIALGIVVYPLHTRIARRLAPRESLAAAISVAVVVIVVVLPLLGVVAAVTSEATGLYTRLNAGGLGLEDLFARATARLPQLGVLLRKFGIDAARFQALLSGAAVEASQFVASRALAIGQDTVRVLVFFFLMLYLLFFFLRGGQQLLEGLVRALPLGDERERHLLQRFTEVSRATIKGTLVVGAVQGTIGGIAFALLGVGAPVLWGTVMALLSIVPAVGTALVWLPAAIVLLASDQVVAGVVLILIGVFGIGMVDNLLRPILVGRDTRMPDYLILLSTLGGLAGFGLAGVVIGPIIAAFFVSVWHMAQQELEPSATTETAEADAPPDERGE